jgi:hypothetical protein
VTVELDVNLRERLLGIELPITRLARAVFSAFMRQTLRQGVGQILVVAGESGSGKSHLRHQLVRDAKSMMPADGGKHLVLDIVLGEAANLLALSRQVAEKYGNPVTMHKLLDKTARDVTFEVDIDIRRQGTKVMFFDEAHNMRFRESSPGVVDDPMALWFKNRTYEGVSFVFFGLPKFLKTIEKVEDLKTRLFRDEPLVTTGLTGKPKADVQVGLQFMGDLQKAFGIDASPGFASREVSVPLIAASDGNLRKLVRLVDSAVDNARLRGASRVEEADFIAAAGLAGVEWNT